MDAKQYREELRRKDARTLDSRGVDPLTAEIYLAAIDSLLNSLDRRGIGYSYGIGADGHSVEISPIYYSLRGVPRMGALKIHDLRRLMMSTKETKALSRESKTEHALLKRDLGYEKELNCLEVILLMVHDGEIPREA